MIPPTRDEVSAWAAAQGIGVRWPEAYVVDPHERDRAALLAAHAARFDCRDNPCVDYGKLVERIPAFVLRPTDLAQLVTCVAYLGATRVPYVVRGSGHSSGAQALGTGVVIELGALTRIVDDHPERDEIEIETGAMWRDLVLHLAPQGRRPIILTDNLRTSIGGTLAVGGFGDTSHLYGLQIGTVTALTLVTPDGEVRRLTPRDELFRYVLAGRGQLGIIATVTLRTMRRPMVLAGRQVRWASVDDFVRDAAAIAAYRLYEYSRVRMHWHANGFSATVEGHVGHLVDRLPARDPSLALIRPAWTSPPRLLDLVDARPDAPTDTPLATPALELVFPLPHGLELWRSLEHRLVELGVPRHIPLGASIMVVANDHRLPLSPMPSTSYALMVALRPALPPSDAAALTPALRELGAAAVRAGAHLYYMSIELGDPSLIDHQLGPAAARLRALKSDLDPHRLVGGAWLAR